MTPARPAAKSATKPKPKSRRPSAKGLAAAADRYELYGLSVQDTEHEVAFFDRVYRQHFRRKPLVLREDFCGTHAVSAAWIRSDPARRAVGVDLDPEPMAWGVERHALDKREWPRLTLIQGDVLATASEKAEVLAAQNFSWWIFKTRPQALAYFKAAKKNLARQGLLVLDMMGGGECHYQEQEDTRRIRYPAKLALGARMRRFTYVWRQEKFNPITHHALFHIDFRFEDRSEMTRAFSYDWRLWTLPETAELLHEAGFSKVEVWWDMECQDQHGLPVYKPACDGEPYPAWLCYVVARV